MEQRLYQKSSCIQENTSLCFFLTRVWNLWFLPTPVGAARDPLNAWQHTLEGCGPFQWENWAEEMRGTLRGPEQLQKPSSLFLLLDFDRSVVLLPGFCLFKKHLCGLRTHLLMDFVFQSELRLLDFSRRILTVFIYYDVQPFSGLIFYVSCFFSIMSFAYLYLVSMCGKSHFPFQQ